MGRQPVKCPHVNRNTGAGCLWTGPYADLKSHRRHRYPAQPRRRRQPDADSAGSEVARPDSPLYLCVSGFKLWWLGGVMVKGVRR